MGRTTPGYITFLALALAPLARAADWPQFRGPAGTGVTADKDLPTEWDAKGKNVVWKAELPKSDNPYASPIVAGDKVFVTVSTDKPPAAHHVLCFAKSDGKPLWKTEVPAGPWKTGRYNNGPTPCADEKHVYAVFGTAVVACLDHDGHIVWRKELQKLDFDVAMGSSPILYGDSVLLLCDQNKKNSSLIAFDKQSGNIKWEALRPEMVFAHSTPVVAKINGADQLLLMVSKGLQGLDPATGKVLWTCPGEGDTASPAYRGNLVYGDGGRGGAGICVDVPPDLKPPAADVPAKLKPKWLTPRLPGDSLGSPTVVGDYLYRHLTGERIKCFQVDTGAEAYTDRLPGVVSRVSPIATADGLLYFASSGKSVIIKAGPKFEVVATNDLGDGNDASAAASDGRLYIKGQKFLWCIGR